MNALFWAVGLIVGWRLRDAIEICSGIYWRCVWSMSALFGCRAKCGLGGFAPPFIVVVEYVIALSD